MKHLSFCFLFVALLLSLASQNSFAQQTAKTTAHGMTMTTEGSNSVTIDIEFFTPEIVHVTKHPAHINYNKESLAVTAKPGQTKLATKEKDGIVSISSATLNVSVNTANGAVTFKTKKNGVLLSEKGAGEFTPFDDAGRATFKVKQAFSLDKDEEIFGLGILQNGKMSQRGEDRDLYPNNTEDGIPFFQSIKGYGVYWDNYSTTHFADKDDATTLSSEVGDAIDYYFIYGGSNDGKSIDGKSNDGKKSLADGVISGIRHLTGDVPMAPLWTYGFHQSKERYKSQDETVGVLHRYREMGVPIDCIIQDWQYWGNNYLWNAMEFMSEQFPNPQAMLDDIHKNNAHCLISIWSSFGPHTKPYKELDEKGLLMDIETWPQSGISHIWPPRMDYPSGVRVYDCYSPEARDIYWKNLRRLYDLGLDGWWMDSTEPDHFNWKESDWNHQTYLGSYRSVRSAFPLMTVGGVYDHQRQDPATKPQGTEASVLSGSAAEKERPVPGLSMAGEKRVFILTRSCTFGQQRTGANTWSGDVVSTWDMLRKQVPAGLNFSLTGNPNFNSDLGGFFAGSYNGSWKGKPAYENPAYRELYARWTQQGVFTPMFRSHGADVPRELWYYGKPGEPVFDALLGAIKLRYRLLPYIYSTAWQVSKNRGTFMRALAMDFPTDKQAVNNNSEYMFGQSILATPVLQANYTPEVIRRDKDANAGWDKNTGKTTMEAMENINFTEKKLHAAYLPAGSDWYLFNGFEADGESTKSQRYPGGQVIPLEVNLLDIPFFVKAGSILPLGPDVQYSNEKPWDNLEIRVYPGADGSFTLYEDEGDGYNYEQGQYTEIPMTWNDRTRTLTIGKRLGSFPGMLETRQFTIKLAGTATTKTVTYSGQQIKIKL